MEGVPEESLDELRETELSDHVGRESTIRGDLEELHSSCAVKKSDDDGNTIITVKWTH